MRPPERFSTASFDTYEAQEPSQAAAVEVAKDFVDDVRRRLSLGGRIRRLLGRRDGSWSGLYFVGPVGTGKTHLLASVYSALHPEVPCAFFHASALFRMTEPPLEFARKLAANYRILCLDEVEIDDPANEARLVHTLRELEGRGVLLVATSNVEPERFLAAEFGNDRFRRFLNQEFRKKYHVVFVGGDDYRQRLERHGKAWIGPSEATRPMLQQLYKRDHRRKVWLTGSQLLRLTIDVPHPEVIDRLTSAESLYLEDLHAPDTDDALRLLRVMDELYLAPAPPVLNWTSEGPPEGWMESHHSVIEKAVSEKFTRTTSRLRALSDVVVTDAEQDVSASA
jgi:cell division protein ZapE